MTRRISPQIPLVKSFLSYNDKYIPINNRTLEFKLQLVQIARQSVDINAKAVKFAKEFPTFVSLAFFARHFSAVANSGDSFYPVQHL